MSSSTVQVAGKRLILSNLEKVLYPSASFTKAHVLDYYRRIGPAILPYLHQRAVTLKRYPDGVTGQFFFEKNCPRHRPDWMPTAQNLAQQGKPNFCLLQDTPSLIWAVNLASLELHTQLYKVSDPNSCDFMVFDLDPGPGADLLSCCRVALMIKTMLAGKSLDTYVKASGKKGLHLYVPLNSSTSFYHVKRFSRAVAIALERHAPDQIVSSMKKALRANKVYVDWAQNDQTKTTVCAWSLRAHQIPTVSAPLSWDKLTDALRTENPNKLIITADQAWAAYEKNGDPMAPVLTQKQKLPG